MLIDWLPSGNAAVSPCHVAVAIYKNNTVDCLVVSYSISVQ